MQTREGMTIGAGRLDEPLSGHDWRCILAVMLSAVAIRCLVLATGVFAFDVPKERIPLLRDGSSYIAYAAAVAEGADGFRRLDEYNRRLFPGYPLLLALFHVPAMPTFGVALNLLAAAAAAAFTFLLYRDMRVAMAMAVLTPSYLMYSVTLMSEPLTLAAGLSGLYFGVRGRPKTAGVLFGVAAVIRPLALSLGVAYVAARWKERRELALCAGITCAIVVGAMAWMQWWSGSLGSGAAAYMSVPRAYGGSRLFTWPFASLLSVSFSSEAAPWKTAYIWAHVGVVLGGLILLARDRASQAADRLWLATNTTVVLCIGGIWGFHEFHRFILPALPPLFYAWRRWLPTHRGLWALLALVSALFAAKGLGHGW